MKPGKKVRNNRAGFTLIEMLIALLVLSIVVAALISMLVNGMFGIVAAGTKSSNMYQTQVKVERAINTGTSQNTPLTITFTDSTFITVPGEIASLQTDDVTISVFIPR